MLITSYKIGGVHFPLFGTNGFHVTAKNKRFTAASYRCRQNLKYENFTSSFGRLRQNIAPKSVPHVQHDHFSSFNQWNHWFVALSLTLPSSNLKLPNITTVPLIVVLYFCWHKILRMFGIFFRFMIFWCFMLEDKEMSLTAGTFAVLTYPPFPSLLFSFHLEWSLIGTSRLDTLTWQYFIGG